MDLDGGNNAKGVAQVVEAGSPMDLGDFAVAVAKLEIRHVRAFETPGASPDNAVLVGRSPTHPGIPGTVLALDRKAHGRETDTELVAEAEDSFFAHWPPWALRPMAPQAVLDSVVLVVEDASPDSVWAVLVLLARMADWGPRAGVPRWLPVLRRWEREGMVDVPETGWPALASALVHARFGGSPSDADGNYRDAWQQVLHFAAQCLGRQQDPACVAGDNWPLLDQARAAMEQERQAYRDWLPHALTVQLSLPVIGGNDRRLLVDALIFTEDQPTGSAKVYYRNDCRTSELGRGFTFAASVRPGDPAREDITITLDARRGVHLRELWEELERRETQAWQRDGVKRPDWSPRKPYLGPYNQPWFLNIGPDDGKEAGTLIAAPRSVPLAPGDATADVPGSRLSWADVQDAIWSVYDPLRGVKVDSGATGETVSLEALAPEPGGAPGAKTVLAARWPPRSATAGPMPRSLGTAPVVERVIAAMIARRPGAGRVSLHELPHVGTWKRIGLSGGFALVTASGVFVLDDWRESVRLDLDRLRAACVQARDFDTELVRLERDSIAPLANEIGRQMAGRPRSEQPGLVACAAQASVHLAALRSRNALVPADPDERLLRDGLNRMWALDGRLAAMEKQVEAIGSSLKALGDAQVRRVTQLVAFVGFPFYLASGLASPLSRTEVSMLRAQDWATGWLPAVDKDPPVLFWWIGFGFVFAVAIVAELCFRDHGANEGLTAGTPPAPTVAGESGYIFGTKLPSGSAGEPG